MRIASGLLAKFALLSLLVSAPSGCSLFASAPKAEAPTSSKITPTSEADFREATANLRPASAETTLDLWTKTPSDPTTAALVAHAYAASEAPGMTLLLALLYRAEGTDCASDETVAFDVARVLTQRITVATEEGGAVSLQVRLAPEPAPVKLLADGTKRQPLAHAFAASFVPALAEFKGHLGVADFHKMLAIWADSTAELGTAAPLRAWVKDVKKAGHLEALSYLMLGLAFPEEWRTYQTTEAAALQEARKYLDSHLFVTKSPLLADDLVPVP